MSVAESIVILPPMSQVGWASACSTVTSAGRPRAAAERAAGGGQDELSMAPGVLAAVQLEQRAVLGVDRQEPRAGRLGERQHERAAGDQRFLVGQGEVDALAERRERRVEARPSRRWR